jgi:hypothetical protein
MRLFLLFVFYATMLASCATSSDVPAATAGPLDSTFRAAGLSPSKIKFKGPVTIQVGGTNNTATAITKPSGPVATGAGQAQDFTKAGQHGGALATAPGSSAGAATRTGVPTWQLLVGAILVLLLLLLGLAYKFRKWPFSLIKIP